MTRLGWTVLAFLAALLLGLLLLFRQGDCDRDDGDDGGDDGMEPACKPGDRACHAGPPADGGPADLELRRADPGEH